LRAPRAGGWVNKKTTANPARQVCKMQCVKKTGMKHQSIEMIFNENFWNIFLG